MSKKIRVLFDANPLVRQKTGVGFYTEGLIKALGQVQELELVGHYFSPRGPLPELPSSDNLSYTHNSWIIGQAVKALRKINIRLPWEFLSRTKADVLLFPDFTMWPSLFGKPRLLTIHDLTFVDYPEYVTKRNLNFLRRYVAKDARRAGKILTISEFSKKRIMEEFGIKSEKILVDPIPPAETVKPKKPSWLPGNYILFISTIEPRKNLEGLVEAYRLLPPELLKKYSLVIAGGQGWDSKQTIDKIKQLQEQDYKIILTGYVDNPTRAALYQNATAVIVPSFYEGFGMPVLEAFSYNALVMASDIPVLREVGGDAAVYFDPNRPDSIRKVMVKILDDPKLRQAQKKRASKKLDSYSWSKVADDIFAAIKEIA